MANFGFSDLRLVDPHPPVWSEAVSAVGAEDLLRRAKAQTMTEALRGCTLILAAADGRRRPDRPVIALPALRPYIEERSDGGTTAVVLGPEKTGLSNADMEAAHAVVTIPTRPETPSMNLGHAAAVIAYELARSSARVPARREPKDAPPAPEQLEDLMRKALSAMDRLDYMRATPEASKARMLREMFRHWALRRKDTAFLQALFRRILAR